MYIYIYIHIYIYTYIYIYIFQTVWLKPSPSTLLALPENSHRVAMKAMKAKAKAAKTMEAMKAMKTAKLMKRMKAAKTMKATKAMKAMKAPKSRRLVRIQDNPPLWALPPTPSTEGEDIEMPCARCEQQRALYRAAWPEGDEAQFVRIARCGVCGALQRRLRRGGELPGMPGAVFP